MNDFGIDVILRPPLSRTPAALSASTSLLRCSKNSCRDLVIASRLPVGLKRYAKNATLLSGERWSWLFT
eukprot:CAMPEP_0119326030 /NCGR_PEP_ID=MMETSP1333-20130426/67288_1 /TAXON_ID=418940 /ORGANISM="Scyphosphaera apsteinii, Strain RCC1455" /LENGTH=68 /DNA_ID=CAMNT_0007334203 /DNA_START=338 /DNA_END=544 /DNA_ORIENTATION=+